MIADTELASRGARLFQFLAQAQVVRSRRAQQLSSVSDRSTCFSLGAAPLWFGTGYLVLGLKRSAVRGRGGMHVSVRVTELSV